MLKGTHLVGPKAFFNTLLDCDAPRITANASIKSADKKIIRSDLWNDPRPIVATLPGVGG